MNIGAIIEMLQLQLLVESHFWAVNGQWTALLLPEVFWGVFVSATLTVG